MAKSYVITGTRGGPGVDNTSEVVLEADAEGNPTKVIGVDKPCELNKSNRETLEGLGILIGESEISAAEAAATPQVGTDSASAGPKISS